MWPKIECGLVVFDCFTIFNELDLLDARLHELSSIVDFFVIVEATSTFQGSPKPLYFRDNASRFERFREKIIHLIIDFPEHIDNRFARKWDSNCYRGEYYQRDQLGRGLSVSLCGRLRSSYRMWMRLSADKLRSAIVSRPKHLLLDDFRNATLVAHYVNRRESTFRRGCGRARE